MAEISYNGSGKRQSISALQHGPLATAAPVDTAVKFALSSATALNQKSDAKKRPQSAPMQTVGQHGMQSIASSRKAHATAAVGQKLTNHGRVSLYDKGVIEPHQHLGPKVVREYGSPKHGLPLRTPLEYLRQGGGSSLKTRVKLAGQLQHHPINRDPPFQKGTGGVRLSWESCPPAASMFRRLYDLGTIDFVCVRWGTLQNTLLWGRVVKRGMTAWGDSPYEVEVAKWLPIFLDGIREYEEPYRFIAIKGSEDLIHEAGAALHACAAELVGPLRRALDTREPTVVAVACELMLLILTVDSQVSAMWIYQLHQFAQVFNLFLSRGFAVNMGYNSRQIISIRHLVTDVLQLMEEHGGPDATPLIRRYMRAYDPAVTQAKMLQHLQQAHSKEGIQEFKPFTLF